MLIKTNEKNITRIEHRREFRAAVLVLILPPPSHFVVSPRGKRREEESHGRVDYLSCVQVVMRQGGR